MFSNRRARSAALVRHVEAAGAEHRMIEPSIEIGGDAVPFDAIGDGRIGDGSRPPGILVEPRTGGHHHQ